MKKLIISLLAASVMTLPTFANSEAWVGGIRYSFSTRPYGTDGKFHCSTYKPVDSGFASGEEYSGDIVIPEEVEFEGKTYVVTSLGYGSFADQANVTSITAPQTLEKIETQALYGTGVSSFIIPEKVNSIGLYPFRNCKKLTELISLNPEPPSTEPSTFQGVDQAKVKLLVPKGCVESYKKAARWMDFSVIEEYAGSPVRPTSVTVTRHPNVMIAGTASQLECMVLPTDATDKTVTWKSLDPSIATVTESGLLTAVAPGRTFVEAICNGNKTISINFNVTVINREETIGPLKYRFFLDEEKRISNAWVIRDDSYTGEVVIPEKVQNGTTFEVTGIDANTFALNKNITSVTFPATIDTVGFNAFRECSSLKTVNVCNLAAWARIGFRDKLASPLNIDGVDFRVNGKELNTLSVDNSVPVIKQFTFSGMTSLQSVTFAEGVKRIEKSAFERCPQLKAAVVPSSVDSIGLNAFANCPSLEMLVLSPGLRTIAGGAFSGTALRTVKVPENVTIIDNQAFQNCSSLKEVELPGSLKLIYLQVFAGCPEIEKITIKATSPPKFFSESSSVKLPDFNSSVYSSATLYVPKESAEAYKAAYGWKEFTRILPIAEERKGVEATIDNITYMLYADDNTAEVLNSAPDNSTIIVPTEVAYEGKNYPVTAIADSAFFNLKELNNIALGENIGYIGKYAFAGTGIDIVAVPQKVCHISEGTFADCASLISVSLPDKLESIGVKAFHGSPKIRYVFCNNRGGESNTPPTFDTYEEDPTNYGEAFSTEIWPDCQIVIPANMFGNYKRCNGWKNFRAWVYWHNYDILPDAITLSPSMLKGEVGEILTTIPALSPQNALVTNFIITGLDREMINLTIGENPDGKTIYNIELLKKGTSSFTLYCGLNKTTCEIEATEHSGIGALETDDVRTRYFNLQGIEIQNPRAGETVIEIRGNKSTKRIVH